MNEDNVSRDQLIKELSELRTENSSLRQKIADISSGISGTGFPCIDQTLLRTLVDLLPAFVYVKDRDSRFLLANESCAHYMGAVSSQDLIGKTDADFYPPHLAEGFRAEELEVLKGIPIIGKEEKGFLNGSAQKILLTTKVPLKDDNGNIIGLVGTSFDITEMKKISEARIASESNLQALINNTNESIWSLDKNFNLIICNDNFRNSYLAAYNVDLKIGINLVDVLSPELRQLWKPKYDTALSGKRISFEFSENIQNSFYYFNVFLNPIYSEEKITGVSALSINITSQKTIEAALREREEWFRNLFEQSSDGLFYMTLDGNIVAVNQSFAEMHGYTKSEIMSMNISDLDCLEPKQFYKERLERLIKGEKLKFEVEHFHKNGHRIPLEVTTGKITMGNVDYILSSHRDITEKKIAEESLRISEENFRVLFEESPLPTVLSEIPTGKIAFVNRRMAELINMDPKDITGKTANDLGLLNDPEDLQKLTSLIETNGFVDNVEIDKIQNDSEAGTDLIFMRLVTLMGKNYCLTVIQDITERKRAENAIIKAREKAEQSDRLKSAFLANMGHEIRTPMNGIMGFSELLKNKTLTGEEQQEYVNIIEKSGARMLNIINDLIDLSKIESGLMNVQKSKFNINEQTDYIYAFFKPEIDSRGLRFYALNGLKTDEAYIETDKEKLNAVIINLIKNAIKFTDKGWIEFGYTRKPGYFEFFVRDTGVGISPEQREIIFERFRQGSESLNRNYEGAGLGLSISKSFVEMLGGTIWMESKVGEGSSFYFTVPGQSEIIG